MDSIGEILKNERTSRGLSLQEVNDATRITVQNLTALEEDRFDYFPNRVYARAFLRDYANFLGLDSATLLDRYEDGFSHGEGEAEAAPVKSSGSAWKVIGYVFFGLLVLAAMAVAVYFGSKYNDKDREPTKVVTRSPEGDDGDVATLPKPSTGGEAVVDKPETTTPEPEPQPAPVVDKVILDVTAVDTVWMRVKADGQVVFIGDFAKGTTKTFEGAKSVNIRLGKAGAVQLKLNDKPQPALGTMQQIGDKTFTLEDVKAAIGEGEPASNPAAPVAPTNPGGPAR